MIQSLHDDELYIIFSHTSNFNVALTCKKWHSIILKKSNICNTCHKITNIGNHILWITDNDDPVCHGYYDTPEKYKLLKQMINYNPNYLQMIKRQSIGLCLYAVKFNHKTFKLIKSSQLNDNIIANIIRVNPKCLMFIEKPTLQNYFNIVDVNGECLEFVPEEYRTHELYIRAIRQTPVALKFIQNQTEDMCLEAIKHPGWHSYLRPYIKIFTENLAMKMFELRGYLLNIEYEIDIDNF